MTEQIFTLFTNIFNQGWQWFEQLYKSIGAYEIMLSLASCAIISRFILYPIFRGSVRIRPTEQEQQIVPKKDIPSAYQNNPYGGWNQKPKV